jgi:hypothetical protein
MLGVQHNKVRRGSALAVVRSSEDQRQPFPRRDSFGNLTTAATWYRLSASRAVRLSRLIGL